MKLNLKVEHADGTSHDVVTNAGDAIRMERHMGVTLAKLLGPQGDSLPFEAMAFMAFNAERRGGHTDVTDFDVWLDTLDTVGVTAGDGVDPSSGETPSL